MKLAIAALGLLSLVASGIAPTDVVAQAYSCANSGAVADPGDNPLLVQDCTTLFNARDTLAGGAHLNWAANVPMEQWEGVTVEGSPLRVVEVRLDNRLLSGRIPPELGTLTELRLLSFRINRLTGEFPVELSSLSELRLLDIAGNQLSGNIPPEIARLTSLQDMDLSANDFDGAIPWELGEMTGLRRLILNSNELSGGIPLQLRYMESLTVLSLRQNNLTGEIPPELADIRNLETLSLGNNNLTGTIPPQLGNLRSLFSLSLQFNELTGGIPDNLARLSGLNGLYLRGNQLTREIPSWISGMPRLQSLDLSDNQFTGSIPATLGSNPILRTLYLFNNDLSGSIPAELGNLRELQDVHLEDNRLSGPLPATLGRLPELQVLVLDDNDLTGEIPPEYEGLSTLQFLSLEGNRLTGIIPAGLGKLENLVGLNLGRNSLNGIIPPALSGLNDLQFLRLNDNFLIGSVPPEFVDLPNLTELDLNNNLLTGCMPWLLSRNIDLDLTHDGLPECPRPPPVVNEGGTVFIEVSDLLEGTTLEYAILSNIGVSGAVNGTVWVEGQRVGFRHNGSETTAASFTYTARSGAVSVTMVESIEVTPVNDPPVAFADTAEVAEGAEVSLDATALLQNDFDPDDTQLQVTWVGDASNGSVSLDGATVTYVHDGSETIAARFSYAASDGEFSDMAIVQVAVTPVNDPPVATPDAVEVDEGASASIDTSQLLLNDTDAENDRLRVTEVGTGVNGTVTLDGLTITYAHDGSETREGSFTYVVSDGQGDGAGIVRLTVRPVNDPPAAIPDREMVHQGESVHIAAETLLVNDTDPDNDTLRVETVSDPVNGTVSLDGVIITYTHDGSETAEGSFTYSVSDGITHDTTIVTIAVSARNRPPVSAPDSAAVEEGGAVTVQAATLLENDVDPDGDVLSVTSVGGAASGVVSHDGATVTFEHDGSESTEARFEYTVSDGESAVTQVVTVAVTPVNDPPVAVDDTFTIDEGGQISIEPAQLLLNDTDAENDNLYVAAAQSPVNGAISFDGSAIVYTHDGSETTEGGFAYSVSDGISVANAALRIAVTPVNDPPEAVPDTVEVDAGGVLSLEASALLANDADAENAALQLVGVADAVNGAVRLTGTTVTFEHDGSETTEGHFAYTVSDGEAIAAAIVRVEVSPVSSFPLGIVIAFAIGAGLLVLLVFTFAVTRR